VDISHTWCKRGEWGILTETADEKRLSQNHEETKTEKQIYKEFCTSRNEVNYISKKYFFKNKKSERSPAKNNYHMKVHETALTELARIVEIISIFSQNVCFC
jgi:hypothetical protein